jgi:hypothetical protein
MTKFFGFLVIAAGFAIAVFMTKKEAPMGNTVDFSSRAPAAFSGANEQQALIDQMNRLVLSIKSKDDVVPTARKILELASQDKGKTMPGVQLYAAAAALAPDLEGIIYRCRAFIEPADFIHMSILFGLRDFSYNDYLYGSHVKALFDFLTYPSHRAGQPFKKVSELQDWALSTLAPKGEEILRLAGMLEKLPAENFEFEFDRTVLVGEGNNIRFLDPEEAKKLFIKPYHYTLTSLAQRALGTLYYVSAMDLDELPIVANKILKKTTINNFYGELRLNNPAKGVTPQMTYDSIRETRSFLAWRQGIKVNGKSVSTQELLDRAFELGHRSAYYQLAAYVCGIKYPAVRAQGQILASDRMKDCVGFEQEGNPESYFVANGSKFLFNPNIMITDFKEKYHMFRDRARAYAESASGKYATILSDVTGQSVRVNLKALFSAKVSQRDFLPTGYTAAGEASFPVPGLPGVRAWNYDYGKPMTFRDYSFGGFFDPSEVTDSKSLYRAMTTVGYTKSIAPFAIFIRVPSAAQYFIPPSQMIRSN